MRKFAAITALAVAMVTGCNTAQPAHHTPSKPATHASHRALKAYEVTYEDGHDNYICAFDLNDLYSFDAKDHYRNWSNPRRSPSDDAACNDPNFVD